MKKEKKNLITCADCDQKEQIEIIFAKYVLCNHVKNIDYEDR